MRRLIARFCWSLAAVSLAVPAAAQPPQAPGVRAAGMGGAFTAVADDATAVYWNPAGLASAGFFSLVLDRNAMDDGSTGLIALGTPPLGLSYYRTATDGLGNGRNSLVVHHAGVTLLQSLHDRLTVGATLKAVHGVVDSGTAGTSSATKFDADLGVMASGSLGHLGLVVHNVAEPEFRSPGGPVRLDRVVRAGVSVNAGRKTIVAFDADLNATEGPIRRWRDAAVGAETHPAAKAWLRGGAHWNTAGDAAAVGSVGGSYLVYGSVLADAQVSFGSDRSNRGWGVGLRVLF
jgi:hypothetical protein